MGGEPELQLTRGAPATAPWQATPYDTTGRAPARPVVFRYGTGSVSFLRGIPLLPMTRPSHTRDVSALPRSLPSPAPGIAAALSLVLATGFGCSGDGGPLPPGPPAETPDAGAAPASAPPPPAVEGANLDPRAREILEALRSEVLARPETPELRLRYAATLDANQLEEQAADAWHQAAALAPKDARARHHLGRLLAAAGRLDEAQASFRAAARLEPRYAPTHWRLGLVSLDLGQLEEARAAFEAARALAPGDPSGAVGLARVALEEDELATAEALLNEQLAAHPADGYLPKLLARTLRRSGDPEAAERFAARPDGPTRCFEYDPWEGALAAHRVGFTADLERARELLAAARSAEALELLEPLHDENPAHLAVEALVVRALLAQERIDEARALLAASAELRAHPRTLVSLGFVEFLRDEFDSALACAERAIEAQPGQANAHFLRGQVLAALGRRKEASEALDAAFARGETSLDAHLLRGQLHAEQGHFEAASDALAETTRIHPGSARAWAMRCEVEARAGRRDEAAGSLAELERIAPDATFLPVLRDLLEDGAGE